VISVDPTRAYKRARPHFDLTQSEPDEETTVIAVRGELDLATAPRLKWPLVDALDAGRRRLVVDLSDVSFMDSTALGVLIGVRRALRADARMAIVCTDRDVLRIFEISGLDVAFQIVRTRTQALSYVHSANEVLPEP
jgi:anti-sigma B factor antagonist